LSAGRDVQAKRDLTPFQLAGVR